MRLTGLPATLMTFPRLGKPEAWDLSAEGCVVVQDVQQLAPLPSIDGIACRRRAMKIGVQRGCKGM